MKVKLIAPSSKAQDIIHVIERAKDFYSQEGVELVYSNDIFDEAELSFFSASNKIRKRDLIESFISKDYNIIWAVRGGYGSANIIESLYDKKDLVDNSKILIGFSDITAIHLLLNQYLNIPSIHGPVLNRFFNGKQKFALFKEFLSKKSHSYKIEKINNLGAGNLYGSLQGGNLTVLTTLIGTKFTPDFKDKFVLLEDVDEKAYQIHRHLMHIRNANIISNAQALIFGDFTKTDDLAEEAIRHFCNNEIDIPAYRIKNIGHGEVNEPIILGADSIIKDTTLTVNNPWL